MPQQIEQGDYILFQDTTIGGPPVLWDWTFQGGSPTGSSLQNPLVRYLSPNTLGYTVKLYVEDSFSIYSTKTENGAIVVLPENLSAISLDATSGQLTLSQDVTYTVTGPTGKLDYYEWNLPGTGGFTGPTSQTQNLKINSWLSLTGSEFGALGSTFTTTASVTYFSIIGNSAVAQRSVEFIKCGTREEFNLISATGSFPIPTLNYITVTNTLYPSSSLGLGGGNGKVYLVSQGYAPNAIETLSSHVEGENLEFWSCSKDFILSGFSGRLPLQLVASKQAFDVLGVFNSGWETQTRYTQGKYMFPYDLSTYFSYSFYAADVADVSSPNWLTLEVGNSNFNTLFFDDAFYATQSSVSISGPIVGGQQIVPAAFLLGNPPISLPMDGNNGASGGVGLQCLPSRQLVGADVILKITIQNSQDGTVGKYLPSADRVIFVTISDSSNPVGNSPDGNLVFAQDTAGGSGYVSKINAAFSGAPGSSLYPTVEAFSSPAYAWKPASYSPVPSLGTELGYTFHGMKLAIKDNVYALNPIYKTIRVRIECNNSAWSFPYNQMPVVGPPTNPLYPANWLGFADQFTSNPYGEIFSNEQPFRGFIFRGNT